MVKASGRSKYPVYGFNLVNDKRLCSYSPVILQIYRDNSGVLGGRKVSEDNAAGSKSFLRNDTPWA